MWVVIIYGFYGLVWVVLWCDGLYLSGGVVGWVCFAVEIRLVVCRSIWSCVLGLAVVVVWCCVLLGLSGEVGFGTVLWCGGPLCRFGLGVAVALLSCLAIGFSFVRGWYNIHFCSNFGFGGFPSGVCGVLLCRRGFCSLFVGGLFAGFSADLAFEVALAGLFFANSRFLGCWGGWWDVKLV